MFTEIFETLASLVMEAFEVTSISEAVYFTAKFSSLVLLIILGIILLGTFCAVCAVVLLCLGSLQLLFVLVVFNVIVTVLCNLLATFLVQMRWPEPACELGDEECTYNVLLHVYTLTAAENFAVICLFKFSLFLLFLCGDSGEEEEEEEEEEKQDGDADKTKKKTSAEETSDEDTSAEEIESDDDASESEESF